MESLACVQVSSFYAWHTAHCTGDPVLPARKKGERMYVDADAICFLPLLFTVCTCCRLLGAGGGCSLLRHFCQTITLTVQNCISTVGERPCKFLQEWWCAGLLSFLQGCLPQGLHCLLFCCETGLFLLLILPP